MPFANAEERALHFARHGSALGAATELDYETMAETFMTSPMTITTRECFRQNGIDRLRINVANRHFAVAVVVSDTIRTYYVVPSHKIFRRGGVAQFFSHECARIDV